MFSPTLLLACSGTTPASHDSDTVVSPQPDPTVDVLPATLHLSRASIALRGVRPSLSDLDAVIADPDALAGIIEGYVYSDEIGPTVRHMHGEWLLTDTYKDYYPAGFPAVGALSDLDTNAINLAATEGAARLAEYIVLSDLPYSTLVTADYTMANPVSAEVFGLPYDGTGDWEVTVFDDGRPAGGVLVDPWYFIRHASTDANRQRARGAHLARALLCHDYMNREVIIPDGVDLTDGGDNAIEENAVCVSCHNTLDPLGAFFAPHIGVTIPQVERSYPFATWDADISADYDDPMFYGQPGTDLASLGTLIAEDSRFARCAVRRIYGQLHAVDADDVSAEIVDDHLPVFADQQVRPLLLQITLSDAFAAAGPSEQATDADLEHIHGLRRITPWQLEQVFFDLTGFSWKTDVTWSYGFGTIGEVSLMDDITHGFRTLSGGPDGFDIWEPMRTTNPTTVLVLRQLAGLSVEAVIDNDLGGDTPRLLTDVTAETRDEESVRSQLARLHLRLYGESVAADSAEVDATWALFSTILADSDPEHAWEVTLYAMLQDPRILLY